MWTKVFASSLLLVFLVEVEFGRTIHAGCAGCGGCDPASACSGEQVLGQGQISGGDSSQSYVTIAGSDVRYQAGSQIGGAQQSYGGSGQLSFDISKQLQGQLEYTGVVSSAGVAQPIQSPTQIHVPVATVPAPTPVIVQQQPQPSVVSEPIRTAPVYAEPQQPERVVVIPEPPVRDQPISPSPAPVVEEVVSSSGVAQSSQSLCAVGSSCETEQLPVPVATMPTPTPVIVQQQPQASVVYEPIRTTPVYIQPQQPEQVVVVTQPPVRYQPISPSPAPVLKEIVIRQTGVQLPTVPFAPCVPTQSVRRKFYVLVDQVLPQLSLPVPVRQSGYKILTVSCTIKKKVTYKVMLKLADTSCYQVQMCPQQSVGGGQWSPYYSVAGASPASCPSVSEQRQSYCQL